MTITTTYSKTLFPPGCYEREHQLFLQETKRKWNQSNFLAVQLPSY